MDVLVACEESQRVCTAFRDKGHNAFSCDILEPSGGYPEWHIKWDAAELIEPNSFSERFIFFRTMDGEPHFIKKWDLIIAHPPCTYLSNAGACRLYPRAGELDQDRYEKGMKAKAFFMQFWNSTCEKVCIENPLPSRIFEMPPYTQIIQPYEFGEPWSKRTCLWLKGLPPLKPTNILTDYKPFVSCKTSAFKGRKDKAGFSRAGGAARIRSRTFWGIANAMAEQWGQEQIIESQWKQLTIFDFM